jgi:D-serine ammonia-lyase
MATTSLYPLSIKEELCKQFVGKSLKEVATPAAIFDLSKLKNNCLRMLEAVDLLNFGWRAHIKTHKVRSYFSLSETPCLWKSFVVSQD